MQGWAAVRRAVAGAVAAALAGAGLAACAPAVAAVPAGMLSVVAAESQYGSVAAQVGGRYVRVAAVERNPNTDPHSYEVSPQVAREIAGADVVIENGLGYDSFMSRLTAASPNRHRRVLNVQRLLHLPSTTRNPHLWYDPRTMPAVAAALAADFAAAQPQHAAYFRANATAFDRSLAPWHAAITAFRRAHHGAAASTEPVANDLLAAMGITNRTPWLFQAAIMNGTDPAPQDVALVQQLLARHRVGVFVYNEQVADPLTASLRASARAAGVPVVGVYETMPTPGYTYQSWMLAETRALTQALVAHVSTSRL